jgi:ATP-dependent exoDNAse (exonuclease V) alpha subunit
MFGKAKTPEPEIELTPAVHHALSLMEGSKEHIFLTGRAGTGKSTLLRYFRDHTKKKLVVLAPTGVAALNVQGQTVHSFFHFKPDITLSKVKKLNFPGGRENLYEKLETIVIDEISMVRADILDCVERFLRLNGPDKNRPFGGIQMIFIGDLFQLPPVVKNEERRVFRDIYKSPFFFSSNAISQVQLHYIELTKIYRQTDETFIHLLNAIRTNTATFEDLELLNTRFTPDLVTSPYGLTICLTTTNAKADEINASQLTQVKGDIFSAQAQLSGKFDPRQAPADMNLEIKPGAQIMFVNNDRAHRWVNGSIGRVVKISQDKHTKEDIIIVKINDGEMVEVTPFSWELFRYGYDGQKREITTNTVGTFTQYPLMLAWAVTIHKAQGKTFERVVVDIGHGTFAHGQLYVAISRCRTLPGLKLKQKIEHRHIFMDRAVVDFVALQKKSYDENQIDKSVY